MFKPNPNLLTDNAAAGYNDPILYLPLDDFEAPGVNLGTGGDFTLNGVVAQSQRGPNQWNCVASEFDGLNDYLSRDANLTGISDGKQLTFACSFSADVASGYIFTLGDGTGDYGVFVQIRSDGSLRFAATNEALGNILLVDTPAGSALAGRTNSVVFACDMTDPQKRFCYINGVSQSLNVQSYTDATIDFEAASPRIQVGAFDSGNKFNGDIGELYFDTTYIDLATSNPFWDEDTQKPKPVLQVLEETGNTPLIAMPIRADDAGRNYGTGGDFTVNSGPFIGARGASEFWARSAEFDGSTGYLRRGALNGAPSSKTISMAISFNQDTQVETKAIFYISGGSSSSYYRLRVHVNDSGVFTLIGENSAGDIILNYNSGPTASFSLSTGEWYTVLLSVDMSNSINRGVYINGNQIATENWITYTNDAIDLSKENVSVGVEIYDATIYRHFDGDISFFYFTTSYIDFSQEANRLKFVDAFGYPVDIRPAIEAGDIPEPLIYMPFDDPNDLGKNLGTGGDFTVNGTVTPGSDVSP